VPHVIQIFLEHIRLRSHNPDPVHAGRITFTASERRAFRGGPEEVLGGERYWEVKGEVTIAPAGRRRRWHPVIGDRQNGPPLGAGPVAGVEELASPPLIFTLLRTSDGLSAISGCDYRVLDPSPLRAANGVST
jgi:hypothetical protein